MLFVSQLAVLRAIKPAEVVAAVFFSIGLTSCGGGGSASGDSPAIATFTTKSQLGEALFNDQNLSFNRSQSCATCHEAGHAFVDRRQDFATNIRAVSLGDDGTSLGDRNAQTLAYARFSPNFQFGSHARFNSQQPDYQGYIGGQFVDGRAANLAEQAGVPFLNPVEMNMPDRAAVVARLLENSDYEISFKALFDEDVFTNIDNAYQAMTELIAEFERSEVFSPFTSKYDQFLAGQYTYDPLSKAAAGKALFFSQQFTNCATCHQLRPNGNIGETFSNYEYHNIGIPKNTAVRIRNGKGEDFVDEGLLANPEVSEVGERGKFKVPVLRNIAVSSPYMHNGIFRELATVIKFYDHFLSSSEFLINPETGENWQDPEIADTVALTELQDGRTLDEADVFALVCFLRTLTDSRYEALIPNDGMNCGI